MILFEHHRADNMVPQTDLVGPYKLNCPNLPPQMMMIVLGTLQTRPVCIGSTSGELVLEFMLIGGDNIVYNCG